MQTQLGLSFHVVQLRTECDIPKRSWYANVLLLFDIPHDELSKTREGCNWIANANVGEVRVEPPTPAVVDYLQNYTIHGLGTH